jgi:hypothetical protein
MSVLRGLSERALGVGHLADDPDAWTKLSTEKSHRTRSGRILSSRNALYSSAYVFRIFEVHIQVDMQSGRKSAKIHQYRSTWFLFDHVYYHSIKQNTN